MSNDTTGFGPALYRYLQAYWTAKGTNQNAWCDEHPGLHAPTVGRWRNGSEPKLNALRKVAEALGEPVIQILVAAEVLTPEEAHGIEAHPYTPTFDDAVRSDPTLTDRERELYPQMREAFRAVQAGETESVTIGSQRARKVTTRKH